jgi:hypothetical protein
MLEISMHGPDPTSAAEKDLQIGYRRAGTANSDGADMVEIRGMARSDAFSGPE